MKIIITLLLALFISGQAYSEDEYKSLKEVCLEYENAIIEVRNNMVKFLESNLKSAWDEQDIRLQKYSKIYHYLDCSDFR
jgi:hypothetical protein